jgi:hypothetical protein
MKKSHSFGINSESEKAREPLMLNTHDDDDVDQGSEGIG